ncbi:hypothetical protein CRE_24784 [Caenorhabditis remanei]|uniref:SET domain-containing protein n=1 Tax=Caenorhabditis remanei TaxID=31234 RepID=E3NCS6_CAERE|nr:hypothetical protein CRE_24784 [Caenorhabditis remanei]
MDKVSKVILKTAPKETFGKFHFHFKCYFQLTCDFTKLKIERIPLCEKLGFRCNDDTCENFAAKIECRASCSEFYKNQGIRQNVCANIEVKPSGDTGYGLFAKENINEVDQVCIYAGSIIPKKEHEKRVLKYKKKNFTHFYAYKVGDLFVDPTESGNLARFANHSCSPNMVAERWQIDRRFEGYRTIVFIAKRPICEGDELTVHYGEKLNVSQECRCGEDNCSGWIGQKKKEPATNTYCGTRSI